jgi:tRNA threonylcarbamoyl adenosine modification protein YjeE
MPTLLSHSVPDTERIAGDFAVTLPPRAVLALHGDLGAGKTQFTRGIVRALGGNPRQVSSPTFTLLNIYPTPKFPVFHLDAYRITSPEDFDAIGFPELLEQPGLVIVEWPTRITPLLPPHTLHVTLEPLSESTRQITLPDPSPNNPQFSP